MKEPDKSERSVKLASYHQVTRLIIVIMDLSFKIVMMTVMMGQN